MAEASELNQETSTPNNEGSNWWGSWLQAAKDKSVEMLDTVRKDVNDLAQSAKEKSAEVFDYVRKDLGEFTQTVQEEVSSTANALKQKLKIDESDGPAATVKRSVTSFLNQVSDAFYIPPEDDDEPIFLNHAEAQIYAMGCDPATFLVDPSGKEFDAWQESLDLQTYHDDITTLLANNEKLRKNRELLVPEKVAEPLFWARYIFRINVVREEELQRQQLRRDAEARTQANQQDVSWDDDETLPTAKEIPEDVQKKLLVEYEKECKERDSNGKKDELRLKEKGDMVLVSRPGDSGSTSPGKVDSSGESNEEEWEKEFSDVTPLQKS